MFTQISIQANPNNNWLGSIITVYRPADAQGFGVAPSSQTVGSLDASSIANAQTAIGYLVEDAIDGGYIIDTITITRIADHVDGVTDLTTQVFTETVRRSQLSIAVTRHRSSDGASGTVSFSTETLPSTVRDAWLSVAALF